MNSIWNPSLQLVWNSQQEVYRYNMLLCKWLFDFKNAIISILIMRFFFCVVNRWMVKQLRLKFGTRQDKKDIVPLHLRKEFNLLFYGFLRKECILSFFKLPFCWMVVTTSKVSFKTKSYGKLTDVFKILYFKEEKFF